MRQIFDELAFIGAPLTDDDLVSSVLNGLGVEYNSFVITVTTTSRHSPLTFSDVHGLLLSHESLLQGQSVTSSLPSIESPAAFAIRFAYPGSNPRPNYRPPANYPTRYPPRSYNPIQPRPSFSFSDPHQPRPGGFNTSQFRPTNNGPRPGGFMKPQCQICFKFGHTAKICYHRFSEDRDSSSSAQQRPSTFHAYLTQPSAAYDDNTE